MSYGAGAPSPGTSRLRSGLPPSTKHELVAGEATTRMTSAHASWNRSLFGEPTRSPPSSTVTAIRQVGERRYAAPSATPSAPVTSGTTTGPSAAATAATAPPTPIELH